MIKIKKRFKLLSLALETAVGPDGTVHGRWGAAKEIEFEGVKGGVKRFVGGDSVVKERRSKEGQAEKR